MNDQRIAQPGEDDFAVNKIEVEFSIPCYITFADQDRIIKAIDEIVRNPANQLVEGVHWLAGIGSKPKWSQMDSMFLGKPVDPDAPEKGEPEFDDDVFSIETCARDFLDDEERQKAIRRSPSHKVAT